MDSILKILVDSTRERLIAWNEETPLDKIKSLALQSDAILEDFAFEKALGHERLAFICECKKASPSKGMIDPDFHYLQIAQEYEAAGAECISVLTEPSRFLGKDEYLFEISHNVSIPCIRKDFVIDEYMLYQAKFLGASAVLLICAILDDQQLSSYLRLSEKLGLSALVETRDSNEVDRAINAGARLIGVNNRNLNDFSVDMETCVKLRDRVGKRALFVAESGIKERSDVEKLEKVGVDAVLVGEALMKAKDKRKMLAELRGNER